MMLLVRKPFNSFRLSTTFSDHCWMRHLFSHMLIAALPSLIYGNFWTRDFSLSFVRVSLKCWKFWLRFMELIRRKLHWRIIQIRGYRWFWATKSAWPLAAQFHLKKKNHRSHTQPRRVITATHMLIHANRLQKKMKKKTENHMQV